MRDILKSAQMKECDKYTIEQIGIPSMVLMERAALMVAAEIFNDYPPEKIHAAVFAGTGNNGGDGIAVARLLKEQGAEVQIVLVGNTDKCSVQMKQQMTIAQNMGICMENYNDSLRGEYNVIVDALFGIGLSRRLKGSFQGAVQWMNHEKATNKEVSIYAVDIPSGIHTDNGEVLGAAVHADKTITFQYAKPGLYLGEGRKHAGLVLVKNIGISSEPIEQNHILPELFCYEKEDLEKIPTRAADGHKGTFGRVLVIAGSLNMAGAAVFSAESAYRTGCGLVEVFTAEENRLVVQALVPEAVLTTYQQDFIPLEQLNESLKKADAIVIGPGLSMAEQAERLVEYTIKNAVKPCVADADALNILAEHPQWLKEKKAPCILTPHIKELARLCKKDTVTVKKDYITIAKKLAEDVQCVVAAKDARTFVTGNQESKCYLNLSGCSGMATGGSGDVLAGIIGSLLAQKMPVYEGACLGVYIHGLAGEAAQKELGGYSMTARDLINNLHRIVR